MQGDANVRVLWGMGYRMERRRRGGNIAGGGAERRNPRIATPQQIEPRSGGRMIHAGITSRANIILYIGICLGEMECWGIAQRKRSFSLSTFLRRCVEKIKAIGIGRMDAPFDGFQR